MSSFFYHSTLKFDVRVNKLMILHFLKHFFSFLRYVYRFVCDLQSLLGYSADELHSMVELGKLLQQHR